MTAYEQLACWAADPENEVFVSARYGDGPPVTYRAKCHDLLGNHLRRIATNGRNDVFVKTRNGITFVTISGTVPVAPNGEYQVVITPVTPFL